MTYNFPGAQNGRKRGSINTKKLEEGKGRGTKNRYPELREKFY